MHWYVIQHKPAQGNRAVENLRNQGATCFYPKVEVERIRGGKRIKKLEPLFNGYLFIRMASTDPLWAKIRSTRGVLRIVAFCEKPAAVEDAVIDFIQHSLVSVRNQGGIREGQLIQVKSGPFKGLSGIFECYEGDSRAFVFITFMQKQQRVELPLSAFAT